jgi:thymidine kinase
MNAEQMKLNSTFNEGVLEIIVGGMYSGKTKFLRDRIERAEKYGDIPVYSFKPIVDNRIEINTTHHKTPDQTILASSGKEIYDYITNKMKPCLVTIDEASFFDESLIYAIQLCLKLYNTNFVVAGLDKDFRGQPFPVMAKLMALSDAPIQRFYATCSSMNCVQDATLTQRLRNQKADSAFSKTIIIEGSEEAIEYHPVCRAHHIVPDMPEFLKEQMNKSCKEETKNEQFIMFF